MRFKVLQIFNRDKNDPEKLKEKLFKKHIEQREAYLIKISHTENGREAISKLRNHLDALRKQLEETLYTIKSQFIVPTLTQIYNYEAADAITWPEISDKELLVSKLPQLPEIEFETGTNATQVEQLKSTFQAQVKQIDRLSLELRHISHSLNLIDKISPTLANQNQAETTASLH